MAYSTRPEINNGTTIASQLADFAVAAARAVSSTTEGATAYTYETQGRASTEAPAITLANTPFPSSYTDCSGWVNFALDSVAPIHEAVVAAEKRESRFNPGKVTAYNPSDPAHPLPVTIDESTWPWARADVLTGFFSSAADGQNGFESIGNFASLQAGDIIAYALGIYTDPTNPEAASTPGLTATTDTGHTMIVAGSPILVPGSLAAGSGFNIEDQVYAVPVIDSSDLAHFTDLSGFTEPLADSRNYEQLPASLPNLFNVPTSQLLAGGLGTGTLWFSVDAHGRPTQFRFDEGDPYFPQVPPNPAGAAVTISAARPISTIDLTGSILNAAGQLVVNQFPNASSDVLDQSFSFPEILTGEGSLLLTGGGTLRLAQTNSFAGGVAIEDGSTLDIAAPGAAGSGPITFVEGQTGTLRVEPGSTPANTIVNFDVGDALDLRGLAFQPGATAGVDGSELIVHSGTQTMALAATDTGEGTFRVLPDGAGGSEVALLPKTPYVVPIYHSANNSTLHIYASLNGGPLEPYLLDSGSSNMFATYGNWWPGENNDISQAGPYSFTFPAFDGLTYHYNIVNATVGIGDQNGRTIVQATNVDVGQITNVNEKTPEESYNNWQKNVQATGAPLSDGTYGNFSAGLYGGNTLATVLAQVPISPALKNGFIVNTGGISAREGTLTIGLTQQDIDRFPVQLQLESTGVQLPNPDGNTVAVNGSPRAQVQNAQLRVIQNGETYTTHIPLVLDTGGGPNTVWYSTTVPGELTRNGEGSGSLNLGDDYTLSAETLQGALSVLQKFPVGTTDDVDRADVVKEFVNYGTRINPGISIFYQYNVMFDLQDGIVGLQPIECFMRGSHILTPRGYVAVEKLAEGDLVMTIGGAEQPIQWLGHREVNCRAHPRPESVWPVRVKAHAFGQGRPRRDLFLSPDHSVFVEGVLIPIKYLINGLTIEQLRADSVMYYHLELSRHDVILAEGLPSETYLDIGNRTAFANGGPVLQLHPAFAPNADADCRMWEVSGCAPLVVTGQPLDHAREALLRQAQLLRQPMRRPEVQSRRSALKTGPWGTRRQT